MDTLKTIIKLFMRVRQLDGWRIYNLINNLCLRSKSVNRSKTVGCLLICIFLCFLMGCDPKDQQVGISEENGEYYEKEFHDCGISMISNVQDDFVVEDGKIFFPVLEVVESKELKLLFCSGDIYKDDLFDYMGMEVDYHEHVGFDIYHDKNSGQDWLCVCDEDDATGQNQIQKFDLDGNLSETVLITSESLGECVKKFKMADNGIVYLATERSIYAYTDGQEMVEFESPGNALLSDVFMYDNRIAGVYRMMNENNGACLKLVLFDDQGSIQNSTEIPLYSKCFVAYGSEILFFADKRIYKTDESLKTLDIVMDLSEKEDQFYKDVFAVLKKDGNYGMVYKSLSDDVVRSVMFHKVKGQKKEKQEITLYDPTGAMNGIVTDQMLQAFNEMNPDYYVTIKEYERDLNYVLVSDDQPDVIFLNEAGAGAFGHTGYLEDLTPYLRKDLPELESGLIDGLTEKIQTDGKLYTLPRTVVLVTLCGYASKVGTEIGWSEDEFVEWFIGHKDALKNSWMGYLEILNYSLEGALDKYVDFEKKESKLNGKEFQTLLQNIKCITTYPIEGYVKASEGDIKELTFTTVDDLAYWNLGEPITFKGYPGKDSTRKYGLMYWGLSMMSTSNNKEGAFELIKFIQGYRYGYAGYFYTVNKTLEKMFEIRLRENANKSEYVVAEEEFWKLYSDACPKDLNLIPVTNIILGEANSYFNEEKSLEDTVEVIHSRVQLWLDERK